MQVGRLTHVAQVRGVDLYIHWTFFLIVGVLLVGSHREPLTILAALAAYAGLLILHESGHVMAARLQGYEAFSIALYPIFGLASIEIPESRFDRALISWGGVAAQMAVAIPVVVCVSVWGYTRVEALNAVLAVFGNYSLCAAAFNLLPIRPLDGSIAWGIIPAYLERRRAIQRRRAT
jgi:Zn-dependent protease